MVGILHAYELFERSEKAVHGVRAAKAFYAAPSVQTAWPVAGKLVGVVGTDRVVGALVKYGLKLALKTRRADEGAAQEMVDLMKSRVPKDTGRLLNGIDFEIDDDGGVTVTASAINPGGRGGGSAEGADYAPFVEFGTEKMEARPFFYNSAEEVLEKHGQALDDVIGQAANEEGLT